VESTAKLAAEHAQACSAAVAINDSLEDQCLSRRASNLHLRAGTFDELVDVNEGSTQAEESTEHHSKLQWLLSGSSTYMYKDSDRGGGLVSQCQSNMKDCASTFEKVLASGSFLGTAPAAVIQPYGMPPPPPRAVLGTASDDSPVPSRCASNMHDRAGTFNELADALFMEHSSPDYSGCDSAACMLSDVLMDNDLQSDVDPFELKGHASGAISRRAANMADASGPFDMLVDDDGDELPDEEDSSVEVSDQCAVPKAEQANVSTVSFNGMLSDADMHGGAANGRPASVREMDTDHNTFFSLSPTKEAPPDLAQRGHRSVLHITLGSRGYAVEYTGREELADAPSSQESWHQERIAGSLLSDAMDVTDEAVLDNPIAERVPSAATAFDTSEWWDTIMKPVIWACHDCHTSGHVTVEGQCMHSTLSASLCCSTPEPKFSKRNTYLNLRLTANQTRHAFILVVIGYMVNRGHCAEDLTSACSVLDFVALSRIPVWGTRDTGLRFL
jgi:hypothetical protein